jgi:hypothetical protein
MSKCFYEKVTDHNYIYNGNTIAAGTKIIKAFKYFEEDKEVLHRLQDAASRLIQEDMVEGIMCLSALQNKWTVFCNGCDSHIDWKDSVKKVIPLEEICPKCNTYHRVEMSLKDKSTLQGCINCELKLKEYYDLIERKSIQPFRGRGASRGMRGGRGNARGGRGGSSSFPPHFNASHSRAGSHGGF